MKTYPTWKKAGLLIAVVLAGVAATQPTPTIPLIEMIPGWMFWGMLSLNMLGAVLFTGSHQLLPQKT